MDFDHRKLLRSKKDWNKNFTHVVKNENSELYPSPPPPTKNSDAPPQPPLPPKPPQPPPTPNHDDPNHASKTTMMIMSFVFAGALLLGIICIVSRIYYIKRRNARRQISQPMLFATQQDFLDGDQGPGINHHIWLINTMGLQQSVIDSITTFRYKKDERLIDGTDCSVCLSEFQEGESLKLLPKCSHAFHIPCIDTWLTSHKNCPLCRAPIVSDNFVAQVALPVPTTRDLSSREETQMENSENTSESMSSSRAEDGASEVRNGDDFTFQSWLIEDGADAGNSSMNLDRSVLRNPRILSDSVGNIELVEAEMQPIRRSVSLDLANASEIYGMMASVVPGKSQANSDSLLIRPKRRRSKRGSSGNLSLQKLMKSSSIRRSLQKGPLSMKRSSSTGGRSRFSDAMIQSCPDDEEILICSDGMSSVSG